jgi:hypothetical protein
MGDIADDVTATTIEQKDATKLNNTEVNSASIVVAVEKIDNQEDGITYVRASKQAGDDVIIAAPGGGLYLRIHHLFVCNMGDGWACFNIGIRGTEEFGFCLAGRGGAVAQNLKRPWDLTENTPLYYAYLTSEGPGPPDISITVGYEIISI